MDSQLALASRDDLWQLQNDMKSVYATQAEHSDRLLRLERRQDDDIRVKSVWGTNSPFPSILSGTPLQGQVKLLLNWTSLTDDNLKHADPGFNPAAEAFKNFDQDQNSHLVGSLHLDTEEEPRRGTSRANSVRFDESALHGHLVHASRSSSEFFPHRTGSGFGSHPMTERSSSHKSEGRQSSVGQSNHSTRLNSLGFETRPTGFGSIANVGPPPGLLFLPPLPSVIRCWLNMNFSNDSLLYAAVCTGSYKSVLNTGLAQHLGLDNQLASFDGGSKIKLQVYLPEATIQQSSSRSSSPVPQLPALTVEFLVQPMSNEADSIQIILGSDLLRARNADVLFSQDRLTIFDDERNKLAVPLIRPENAMVYQNLLTVNHQPEFATGYSTIKPYISMPVDVQPLQGLANHDSRSVGMRDQIQRTDNLQRNSEGTLSGLYSPTGAFAGQQSVTGEGRGPVASEECVQSSSLAQARNIVKEAESLANGTVPDTPTTTDTGNMWGSWRRDSNQPTRQNSSFSSVASSSGHPRTTRGRGMKVLKPSRSVTISRAATAIQPPPGFEGALARTSENDPSLDDGTEILDSLRPDPPVQSLMSEAKSPLQPITDKARSANPIGGASAFGWLNSSQRKQSATTSGTEP